jgi:hypothetical protein
MTDFRFDAIDGDTGAPLYPPLPRAAASRLARGLPADDRLLRAAALRQKREGRSQLGLRAGCDVKDLAQAGWGVIFPRDGDPAVREALQPLLDHRERQAGPLFRIFAGDDGYRGQTWRELRESLGGTPSQVDPEKIPFYLLLAGDPEAIPFDFQTGLDVQHAVGRLAFDTPEGYDLYARAVVASETAGAPAGRRAAFFGIRPPDDETMHDTADHLLPGLARFLAEKRPGWAIESVIGEGADKARLARLLGGGDAPDLLFAACHGLGFQPGRPHQSRLQGALACPTRPGPLSEDQYFAGDDVGSDVRLAGRIAFLYACHGAGTPRVEAYPREDGQPPQPLAPAAFVARLPQRLLGHPGGGALAVVGHIERAWCHSFVWNCATDLEMFQSALLGLLDGLPVGAALEPLAQRYLNVSLELGEEREKVGYGKSDDRLLELWTAAVDSRNHAVLGDPAVRLRV